MKIAVLSGKGGAGKTTISVNLANVIKNSVLIDTDVEEPNVHIYFETNKRLCSNVNKDYPVVDETKCTLCGECGEFCMFNAIMPAKNKVLVFKELCHDCGGCKIVCKSSAINYEKRNIGKRYSYSYEDRIDIMYGELNVGELSGVTIIEELKKSINNEKINIIDCPPGVACATVAAINNVDYAIIVAEATPFGLSDMKMVVELLREMETKFSVVINKAGLGDVSVEAYCKEENLEVLASIDFDEEAAWHSARGSLISEKMPKIKDIFVSVADKILSGECNG